MASCLLCSSLQGNLSKTAFTTKLEAQSHAAEHFRQTKHFDDNCNSLDQMFEQCFPNFEIPPLMKRLVKEAEGRQSLLNLCHTLLDERISKISRRVTCQKCGTDIVVCGKRGGHTFGIAIDHASAHLRIDLYECRQCGRGFGSKNTACVHLKTLHGHGWHSDYYVDKSQDFIDEIGASIKECFSENDCTLDKKARMIRLRNVSAVRSCTKGTKLAEERNLLCYRLIWQQASDDGKMQCRLCSKRIKVKRGSAYRADYAMGHAFLHLRKPIFRCKICSIVRANRCLMLNHLKSAHGSFVGSNCECLADKFHPEIMAILKASYADEAESK